MRKVLSLLAIVSLIVLLYITFVGIQPWQHGHASQNIDSLGVWLATDEDEEIVVVGDHTGDSRASDTGNVSGKPTGANRGLEPIGSLPDNTLESGAIRPSIPTSRRLNIAIIGCDARIGDRMCHADANHVFSVDTATGRIEIISVPRDTPADAGMPDTSGMNKLTIVLANRGMRTYLKELSRIAGVGPIPHYVQVNFSQALGLMELVGIRDTKSTLQVLRSRQGLGGDDYQRCFNQGTFIGQVLTSNFSKVDGVLGSVLLRSGLYLTENNLTMETVDLVRSILLSKGFPNDSLRPVVIVRPRALPQYKRFDLTDSGTVAGLKVRIERFNRHTKGENFSPVAQQLGKVPTQILGVVQTARRDSAVRPARVISALQTYYDQKVWYQIEDRAQRANIRASILELMESAYRRTGKQKNADRILDEMRLLQ